MEIDDNETSTAFSSSSTGDSVVDSSINNSSSSKNRARPITAPPVAVAVSSSNGSVGNNPPLRAIHTAPHPQSSTNNNNNEQNVRVVARVRPLSNKEITEKSSESIVAYSKQSTIRVHSSSSSSSHGDFTNSNDNNIDQRNFEFDSVFGPNSTQEQVYEGTCGDMINSSIFKGFNATILAYGQTGSGKVRQHSLFFVRFERDTLLLTNLLYITFSLSLDLLDVYNGHRWQYRKYQSKERRLGLVNNNETTISNGWDNCPCRL